MHARPPCDDHLPDELRVTTTLRAHRSARPLGVAMAALIAASLAGCAVNAGSAASDRFDADPEKIDAWSPDDGEIDLATCPEVG